MRVVLFYRSTLSIGNSNNFHLLKGLTSEFNRRGHEAQNFDTSQLSLDDLELDSILSGADLILVHEMNDPEWIERLGLHHLNHKKAVLLFHDTCHQSGTKLGKIDLAHYDGVLAYGQTLAELYLNQGVTQNAWAWYEAVDPKLFRPMESLQKDGDLIWIGNWGNEERAREYEEFLIGPARDLGIATRMHGAHYTQLAQLLLEESGIEYGGWLAPSRIPEAFSKFTFTLHIPRQPIDQRLAGIPGIRVFEALACGIPLVCTPGADQEGLFTAGDDYAIARNGQEMRRLMKTLLFEPEFATELGRQGRETLLTRHTWAHRVDELLSIYSKLRPQKPNTSQGLKTSLEGEHSYATKLQR